MKTILAATDFSYNAHNAVDYATELAKVANAKLILLHVYYIPIMPADESPWVPPIEVREGMEKECLKSLNEIRDEILANSKKPITIECICREGIVVDTICQIVEEKNIDLVVMGIKGNNNLVELMIGSNTSVFIEKGNCPLLAINENVSFKKLKRIVLACGENLISKDSVVNTLKEFVDLFKARLYVLNVLSEPNMVLSDNKADASVSFERVLETVKHSVHFIENKDVIDGINQFAEEEDADMISMIPAKRPMLLRLFHKSNTKKMVFHSHLPLLVLQNIS